VYTEAEVSFATRPHIRMMVGNEYVIECRGDGGVPAPILQASIGEKVI